MTAINQPLAAAKNQLGETKSVNDLALLAIAIELRELNRLTERDFKQRQLERTPRITNVFPTAPPAPSWTDKIKEVLGR